MYRRIFLLIALLIVVVLELWQFSAISSPEQIEIPNEATSASAIRRREIVTIKFALDGDTIELTDGRRVRYIGIDAPEIAHEGNKQECYARESLAENKSLVAGKIAELETDVSDTDSYGRLLRYVYIGDVMINDLLVEGGFARAWNVPPDERYKTVLFQSHVEAKSASRGVWQGCSP